MSRKEEIIENVSHYSAEELVEYIVAGYVTFEELEKENPGEFSHTKRQEVKCLLELKDDDEWKKAVEKHSIEAAQWYLNTFPYGKHRNEARNMIDEIKEEEKEKEEKEKLEEAWSRVDQTSVRSLKEFIEKYPSSPYVKVAEEIIDAILFGDDISELVSKIKQIQTNGQFTTDQKYNNIVKIIKDFISRGAQSKDDFLNVLSDDHNLVSAGVVKRLMDDGTLTKFDLINIGIDKKFIRKIGHIETAPIPPVPELEKIYKQSTEIYFWGIPSSGKSCALGAILSVAASGSVAHSMKMDIDSQGYGYMNRLIALFDMAEDAGVVTLVAGTAVTDFYEMGFDLVDEKGNTHPITCIDMAGELMRCMYKSNADEMLNESEVKMLDTMTKVLIDKKTTNRKMHIFVIEYGAEDRKYEGLPQRTYLDGAVAYIENTGIFKKDTDAIFVMITKADKVKNATKETFTNYLEHNYKGFINGLERICKDNEINHGKVEKIAFSLGEVCFQNYCRFNPKSAENIVRIILERSAKTRGGKLGFLSRIFRG